MERLGFSSIWMVYLILSTASLTGVILASSIKYTYFQTEFRKKLNDSFIYHKEESISVLSCAASCWKNEFCLSLTYDENERLCRLSKYRIKGGRNPERLLLTGSHCTVLSKVGCLNGWIKQGEECYLFNEKSMTYNEAKEFCEQKAGMLAEPLTNSSFELLRQYAVNTGSKIFWIGLNDIVQEGKFIWTSNGVIPGYSAWANGEPNDGTEGNCVAIRMRHGHRWGDATCSSGLGTICEN